MKYVNDDELVLGSSKVVLEVHEWGKDLYKILIDIVKIKYRHFFHLKYKNKSNDSNN
jgi:hypothetical protein